ncbi:MAG: hypothetical protein IKO35_03220 [Elusimicrobiaceae bacterium]|nr:hypothetical protein [Elusimicrobiaceae bacterium]
MKKIIFLLFVLCAQGIAQARTVDVHASYTGASRFDQAQVGATMALTLNTLVGLEAKLVNERAFKDPIYAVALPVSVDFDILRISLRPFYYLKNKSNQPAFQDASAFGVSGQARMTLREDTVNDIYTYAFINAAFARQKGTVFFNNAPDENRYYSQAAYLLGISNTLFNAFGLDLIGTVFQYPNGISGVAGLRSIMNQQELANTQTLDIVHDLAKYTLGARLTRMWPDNNSSLYASYRYAEYHTADPEHSIVVGNSFPVAKQISMDLAYNHVRSVHNKNRRDILFIQLTASF